MGQWLESNKTLLFYPTYLSTYLVPNIYGMADNTIGTLWFSEVVNDYPIYVNVPMAQKTRMVDGQLSSNSNHFFSFQKI